MQGILLFTIPLGLATAYYSGVASQQSRCQNKLVAQQEVWHKQHAAAQTRAHTVAANHLAEQTKRTARAQKLQRKIENVVQKPVYAACRIDDAGLRLLNTAVRQANRSAEPTEPLP
jgi:hypothetical protein